MKNAIKWHQFDDDQNHKNQINIIDQTQLPFKTAIINLRNTSDFCEAITKMKVRGAPLIGVTAAFGLALAIKQNPKKKNIEKSYEKLLKTRPTAINLKWALDEVKNKVLVMPARVACTGSKVGPSLYHLFEVLGQAEVLKRFDAALARM